ncbi:zinc finger and BTB domain-containing protein 7B isoform X2 [Rhineura floridana]|nr:zinc finger and BTB domain-containing protein 7B isoform X2 [Rhineura floridana]XP_061462328.1 zinc finger and BTB domain-containing protein 7B isoform X2 [Rhineura floridana]XP_061462329.1 zinc finger and BTB domain-containing protein 7B isoform X2 [Rhineura floridana]XP_061462330.1 zinc finger and BTB domain-containing protein 7B isoform X2 [Rhineura floridana]XP_061462332.1 zinc finger and BTB domain-containing protein 7B isoform X2 [Rhineura floridana]XP_061462333.1 zinc finger and BTB 
MGSPEDDLIGIPFPEHSSELLGSLNEQRRRGVLCDVTLRAQGSEYRTHRAVLAASSRYFQRLFAGPGMGVCELDFVGAEALGALLDFAYTATLTISTGSLGEVLRAARLLEIPCVIAACMEILQGNGLEAPVPDDAARERARRYLEAFATLPSAEGDLAEPLVYPAPRRSKKTRKFLQTKGSRLNNHVAELSLSPSPSSTGTQERPSPPSQTSPAPALIHPREDDEEALVLSRSFPYQYTPGLSPEDLGSDDEPVEHDIVSYMRALNPAGLSRGLDPPDKLVRKRRSQMPQECPVCHKVIHGAGKLPRHMRTHTGEKPFACEVCGVRFTRNDKLKIHMRKHTGERPYSCPHCTARFLHSYDLKNHLHLHTGARPYECCLCHKAFAKDDHLQRHLKGQNCLEVRTRRRRRGAEHEPDSVPPAGMPPSSTDLDLTNGQTEGLCLSLARHYWDQARAHQAASPLPKEEEEEEEEEEGREERMLTDGPPAIEMV